MLDAFTREISARWGLGDQGKPLLQMLVAHISNPATGGLPGFLDKFRKAGWGGMVNTWVDNGRNAEVPTTAQVETVLGTGDGFLRQASAQLGLSYDKVIAAVAGLLPQLIGRMTPDGTIPAVLPAEFGSFAREGQALLAAGVGTTAGAYGTARSTAHTAPAAAASAVPASSGGFGKWLPWLIGALVVIFGVSYCSKTKEPVESTPPAQVSTAPAPMPAEPVPQADTTESQAATAEPQAGTAEPGTAEPQGGTTEPQGTSAESAAPVAPATSTASIDTFTAPEGAGVLDDMHNGMPVLRVFFDPGKTDVATTFAEKSKAMVDFLNANPDVKAVISGFNDPTGDAARNAELSKQRAEAVKAALESAGVAADRAILEKPAETTDTGASNAASRRVDVMLRR